MDITLKQLQVFQAVVVAGSITRASRRISLSQPSISQQLAKLEETLKTQLILRNRTGVISLTPAGEFWFKLCDQTLRQLDQAFAEHERRFVENSIHVRLGVPPTLRGHFVAAAAQIASAEPGFTKFELAYALTSIELVEQLRVHQLNFAIVSEEALADDRNSFAVAELFKEPMCWIVPRSVPLAQVEYALSRSPRPQDIPVVLQRFVEIDANVPLRAATTDWYRHNIPTSSPMYSATTYASAVDIVAEGLATTHAPSSLLPNLPNNVRDKLQVFKIKGLERGVVLAMQKHLQTLPGYANIFRKLTDFCREEYAEQIIVDKLIGPAVPESDVALKRAS